MVNDPPDKPDDQLDEQALRACFHPAIFMIKIHLDGWFEGDVVHLSFTRSFPLMDPGPSIDNPSGPSGKEILMRFHEATNAFRKVDYQWKYIGGTQVLPFGGPRVPQLTIHLVRLIWNVDC